MAKTKVSELIAKRNGDNIDIFDGETRIGYVSPVLGASNRPTGTWSYTIPEHHMGKAYNAAGYVEKMLDYVNWNAGRNWRDAAVKLAHKCGYKE